MNRLICSCCKRNINALGQDNMSSNNRPLCEDCWKGNVFSFNNDFYEDEDEENVEDEEDELPWWD